MLTTEMVVFEWLENAEHRASAMRSLRLSERTFEH